MRPPICPPGMHQNMSAFFLFSLFFHFFFVTSTCFRGAFQPGEVVEEEGDGEREGGREEEGMRRMQKQESKQRQGQIQEGLAVEAPTERRNRETVASKAPNDAKIPLQMFSSSNLRLSFAPGLSAETHTHTSSPL